MTISHMKATIPADIRRVWETVLAVERYAWRSDLSRTEVVSETQFIEYTKNGYPTTFTVTAVEPYRRWAFDMENSNISGSWAGVFAEQGGETEIDFTECVTAKKRMMQPLMRIFLKRQQARFVADLKRALRRESAAS